MVIKMYNRLGIESGKCLFPGNVFEVQGYSRTDVENCFPLEEYVKRQLKEFQIMESEEIELQVNGGYTPALISALNVLNEYKDKIYISYRDINTGIFHKQILESGCHGESAQNEKVYELIKGRHIHEALEGLPCIYEENYFQGNDAGKRMFCFSELEKIAENEIANSGTEIIRLYATGLSQCLVSVIKACRKHGKKLIVMHFNHDTDQYFAQVCK